MSVEANPVTWRALVPAMAILATMMLWSWGVGYWMGTRLEELNQRISRIEKKT